MLGRRNPPDSTFDFLSDPTQLPAEFKSWLRNWLLNQPATTTGTAVALPTGNAGGDLAGSTYPSPFLKASGVTAATYGDATHVGQVAVNAKGLVTAASSVAITFPSSGYATVQDEGTPLTQRATIDFAGAGVTATDDSGNSRTLVTIPGGGGGGAITQICDLTLGAAQASFDTNTILGGNISGVYNHLKIVLTGRTDNAVTAQPIYLKVNNDATAGNYVAGTYLDGNQTTASSGAIASTTFGGYMGSLSGASATAGRPGVIELLLPNYVSTTFHKAWSGFDYTSGADLLPFGSQWSSTVAVTRLTLAPSLGNLAAGTRFTLYGLT